MTIVVTGSRGQLGWELCRCLGPRATGLDRAALDVTDLSAVDRTLRALAPEAVINTAAYTAVDRAESEPEACFAANEAAVGHLVAACQALGCPLVQISTDYVFSGTHGRRHPYREDEPTSPRGVYARSKWAGEEQARRLERHIVVRTCGLYGRRAPGAAGGNFVDTMLRLSTERPVLKVVDDQICTPSYVPHVAAAVLFLLAGGHWGTYHVVNQGSTSWFEFAREIFRQIGREIRLEPITTAQYAAPAPRPAYSVLDTSKYRALDGPELPAWQDALRAYLAERVTTPSEMNDG